jgi:hypothetical protein
MLLEYTSLLLASSVRKAYIFARFDKNLSLLREERDLQKVPSFPFVMTVNCKCIGR